MVKHPGCPRICGSRPDRKEVILACKRDGNNTSLDRIGKSKGAQLLQDIKPGDEIASLRGAKGELV